MTDQSGRPLAAKIPPAARGLLVLGKALGSDWIGEDRQLQKICPEIKGPHSQIILQTGRNWDTGFPSGPGASGQPQVTSYLAYHTVAM